MHNQSFISYVMPAYNCANTIIESVESIMLGNFRNGDQLIIINDASTDNTYSVLLDLQKKYPKIIIINNEVNRGCPASRNIGISIAENNFIFNLDSDNILVANSVSKLLDYLITENADVASFGAMYYFKKSTKKITHKWIFNEGILTLADFFAGHINPGPGGNFLYRKSAWERVGKYWEYGAGLHEAWGFSLKLLAHGCKFVVLANSYYFHRYGHSSLFVRESQVANENIMANKMINPYLNLLEKNDINYILSDLGNSVWFTNLNKRPLTLVDGVSGKTGRISYTLLGYIERIKNLILNRVMIFLKKI